MTEPTDLINGVLDSLIERIERNEEAKQDVLKTIDEALNSRTDGSRTYDIMNIMEGALAMAKHYIENDDPRTKD